MRELDFSADRNGIKPTRNHRECAWISTDQDLRETPGNVSKLSTIRRMLTKRKTQIAPEA